MRCFGYLLVALVAGCSFSGASGTAVEDLPPDAGDVDAGAVSVIDAAPNVCAAFKAIGTGRYLLSDTTMTWDQANDFCKGMPKTQLVSFETLEEITAVVQDMPIAADAWTGVIQKQPTTGISRNWINSLASTPIPAGFPWEPGEPNDGGGWFPSENRAEDVAELHATGRFNDQFRTDKNRALCECRP
jgi:Lectin C-type domain